MSRCSLTRVLVIVAAEDDGREGCLSVHGEVVVEEDLDCLESTDLDRVYHQKNNPLA